MKQHRSNAGKRLAEEAKRTGFAAPGSDEAAAKRIMEASEARKNAFAKYMESEKVANNYLVDRVAWEAFKAGEKFGRGHK